MASHEAVTVVSTPKGSGREKMTDPLVTGKAVSTAHVWRQIGVGKESAESVLRSFASLPTSLALEQLETNTHGLGNVEAATRLNVAGCNVLSSRGPPRWWQLMLLVVPNPFNILLAALAVISVATPEPEWATFGILMAMIVISCIVRFWQEYRSSVAVIKLRASIAATARVYRQLQGLRYTVDNRPRREIEIDEKHLVPGDIILVRPGDNVPADCRILDSSHLHVGQSGLTGENEPVRKSANVQDERNNESIFELDNILFMGTNVVAGSAVALVLRTGDRTFIATIVKEIQKRKPMNSFQRGIRNVSYMLLAFMLVMVPIVLVISGTTTGKWGNAALFSLSVAVGLVPEMLPAIVNANLARGSFHLSKKKAIVKRLDSIQNLGGMSVLCSDKTGTLTKDEIALRHFLDPSGCENSRVLHLAHINASCQGSKGNSIDAAILNFRAPEATPNLSYGRIDEIPFTFERRMASAIIRSVTQKHRLICKGAYDEVSALCSHIREGANAVELDATRRQKLAQQVAYLNAEGYRVIVVATKELHNFAHTGDELFEDLESNMTLEGLLTFLDPPKDDAATAIARLQNLGVDVRILTGDTLGVAMKVCRALNIVTHVEGDEMQAITGPDLAKLEEDPEAFDRVVGSCKVFAKVTPGQKAQVVRSLKRSGHCVGMLGDGINDCIALRHADVGISVDSATGVAKDAADVILTEKELDIIVDCVTTGRVTHGNTIKYIKMVASSNFGNVFSILVASAWLPFQPMTSLQILIQNLLYDFSQIAIPWDRMDEEYLREPKKWDAKDLLRFIVILGPTSSTIDICTFCLGWFFYGVRSTADPAAVDLFQTHWFMQGLLTQTLIVHLLRTAKLPFIQSRASRGLIISTVTVMVIGFVLPWIPPLHAPLDFVNPAASFVGFLAAELLLYCVEVQLVKMLYVKIFKTWL